jgi:hypothetical protein
MSFPATRSGATAIFTGNGAFLRARRRGTRASYYESLQLAAPGEAADWDNMRQRAGSAESVAA